MHFIDEHTAGYSKQVACSSHSINGGHYGVGDHINARVLPLWATSPSITLHMQGLQPAAPRHSANTQKGLCQVSWEIPRPELLFLGCLQNPQQHRWTTAWDTRLRKTETSQTRVYKDTGRESQTQRTFLQSCYSSHIQTTWPLWTTVPSSTWELNSSPGPQRTPMFQMCRLRNERPSASLSSPWPVAQLTWSGLAKQRKQAKPFSNQCETDARGGGGEDTTSPM